jgi:rare lipoprotein A
VNKGILDRRWLALAGMALLVGACAQQDDGAQAKADQAKPAGRGVYKIGQPYRIEGLWYYPKVDYDYVETGIASWYGSKFHGRATANGETYDMNALTAAHRTLPMPSYVRVTNLENGRSMVLRINDRGPFARARIIDASRRAAQLLGFERQGTARVRVRILADESRALLARLKGETALAAIGTPINVDRLPKAPVAVETLAPPAGASQAPPPKATVSPVAAKPEAPPARDRDGSLTPELGVVTSEPVTATSVFVQAGAYARFDNANRVRAMLARLGDVKVTQILIGGRDLFRVRVGPIADIDQVDLILDRVIRTGYPDARIIVD